ncbi:MAG TPA: TfuA-like protein [Allosphingosinicella sp.]|nr:TfuA-like protein [Allosphingosinicella sp.]
MTIIVFAGPSLPGADRAAPAPVDWRPPAEAGDLLRLDLGPGLTICLIDGYFDHRPAVRHKEILLALAEGARVIGASSMGALRAAEMAGFGMEPVGVIARAFAGGRLSGDDEVALVHGPAEWDWRPLSVPLVEVRATLRSLRRRRLIAASEARRLFETARAVHFADRCWASIGEDEAMQRLIEAEHVPLKRLDAIEAVRAALTPASPAPRPQAVSTSFLRALAREVRVPPR